MLFRQHPESLERLEPWLDRELHVLLGAEEDVELVKEFVLSLMRTYDLQSAAAMRELRPFFFERTEQFVHELVAFARSPFPMGVYDRYVQYGTDEVDETAPAAAPTDPPPRAAQDAAAVAAVTTAPATAAAASTEVLSRPQPATPPPPAQAPPAGVTMRQRLLARLVEERRQAETRRSVA
jgi:hypothetical protein